MTLINVLLVFLWIGLAIINDLLVFLMMEVAMEVAI